MDCDVDWMRALVRPIDDFPEPGIRFADITPVLANADALRCAVELMVDCHVGQGIDLVAGVDARGFILGAPIACRLGTGFIPVRKAGRLPAETQSVSYDLEYGSATLELHVDAITSGQRVLLVDDVLATGGTAMAARRLIEDCGGDIAAACFLLEIDGLDGRNRLGEVDTTVALGVF